MALFEEILTMSTTWTVKSVLAQKFLLKPKTTEIYSSNKIRKARNEYLNIDCHNFNICRREFNVYFLILGGLFLLLFDLETVEVS